MTPPDPAKVIAEAREKNPYERLHPAWAGTEHVAWEDGFDAAVDALAAAAAVDHAEKGAS